MERSEAGDVQRLASFKGMELHMSSKRNRTAIRVFSGALALAALALTGTATLRTQATAAPGIDASAPLTISRKPPSSLSAAPGIRLARIASEEGSTCYRASRYLASSGRTLSETFCTYE